MHAKGPRAAHETPARIFVLRHGPNTLTAQQRSMISEISKGLTLLERGKEPNHGTPAAPAPRYVCLCSHRLGDLQKQHSFLGWLRFPPHTDMQVHTSERWGVVLGTGLSGDTQ